MPRTPSRPAAPRAAEPDRPRSGARLSFKFRMRVTDGDQIAVGPGRIALLEAIDGTGSITAAAKALNMSYRRAWLLLDALNGAMRVPAVDSAKGGPQGGGSVLTDEGRRLVALYRGIEEAAAASCRGDIDRLLQLLRR